MIKKFLRITDKLKILEQANNRQLNVESPRSIARSINVQPNQIRRWRGQRHQMVRAKKAKKTLTPGRTSSMIHLEADLVQWFLDLRETGICLSYRALCRTTRQ